MSNLYICIKSNCPSELYWINVFKFICCRSYNAICSRLHCLLDSLREMVLGNSTPTADALIQLSFTAIQTVNSVRLPTGCFVHLICSLSWWDQFAELFRRLRLNFLQVFCSMNENQKEQNKDILSRFQFHPFLLSQTLAYIGCLPLSFLNLVTGCYLM